jgi:hypothetical protein
MTANRRPQRPPMAPSPRGTIAFPGRSQYVSAKAVGSFLPALTTKAFERYGFSTVSLITDWAAIVGRELAASTTPERVKWQRTPHRTDADEDGTEPPSRRSGATLVLRVTTARALEVQYAARQIIERINAYFGYAAIAELRLIQAPAELPSAPARQAKPRPQPVALEAAGIADAGLRDALARLGGEVRGTG